MVNLVAAGLGVALVPASLAGIYNDAVTLCRLSGSTLNGDVYALRRLEAIQPAAAECLQALLDWAKSHPMDAG